MIEIKGNKLDIDPETSLMKLKDSTSHYGIFIDLDRVIEAYTCAHELMKPLLTAVRDMSGDQLLFPDSKSYIDIYIKRFGVPSKYMKEAGKVSAGKPVRKRLMTDPNINESARFFAKIHDKMSDYNTIKKLTKTYMDFPLLVEESFDNHRMVNCSPFYHMLSTARLQSKDPNIQGLSRAFADFITYPKEWLLIRADSGQIEPRIMYSHFIRDELIFFLIKLYNDAYYGLLHFIVMTPQEEIQARANLLSIKKRPFTREDRDLFKLAALAAGYGSNLEGKDVPYANLYVQKINNHPLRKEWEDRERENIRRGVNTFYAAFGYPITPDETDKYKKDALGWNEHMLRCAINNPIQGTASELMCKSVDVAYAILMGNKSKICYYKHDEGAFYLTPKEHYLKDHLKEVMSYNVNYYYKDIDEYRQWLPIESDYLEGKKEGSGFGLKDINTEASVDIESMVS